MWVPRMKDAALAAAVLLAQSAPFLFSAPAGGAPSWRPVEFLPVLGSALPVAFRRTAPLLCLLVTELCVGAYAMVGTGPAQPVWYGALVNLYTVANRSPARHRAAAAAITTIGLLTVVGSLTTAVRELLTWSAAFVLGTLARTRRELAEVSARQAAAGERARIAADLHDILGHAFSMMVVQAEAGGAVVRRDPERAATVFDTIATTGRDAMRQLRQAVGTLKDGPPPGLADLAGLAARAERAGLRVRMRGSGVPRAVSPEVELAVFRVVQEALTNVVKHARASSVEIRTGFGDDGLRVSVADDGAGCGDVPAEGHGLALMRERVAAAGGAITVGTGLHGRGFAVTAVFP